jgi:hypothetical protein
VITDNDMPGWLTADNAWWCAGVLAILAAVCIIAMFRDELHALIRPEQPTDWDAPATDLDESDDDAFNGGAPTVWSDAVAPGGLVCAAQAEHMPDGICGWPVESEPCPAHGHLAREDAP